MRRIVGLVVVSLLFSPFCAGAMRLDYYQVAPGTPVPTSWDKEEFDRFEREIQKQRKELRAAGKPESEMEALFRQEREKEDAMLASQKCAGKVGGFEGADYESKGYYRPEVDCIMFTSRMSFCAVCRRAIEHIIAMYTD